MLSTQMRLPHENIPSEKLLIASIFLCLARKSKVTSGEPSLIMKCTVMRLLNTTVHVESRRRFCNDRKTSATPYSPEWVATRMCSIYFVFGGAAWRARFVSNEFVYSVPYPGAHLDLRSTFHRFFERASHVQLLCSDAAAERLDNISVGRF
jgi:hypothetical protein